MSYRQLTLDERYQIQFLVRHFSIARIARIMGRHRSTIARELARNSDENASQPYLARRAQKSAGQRRIEKGAACRKIQGALQELVELKLRLSWSPEQISGRLRRESSLTVSHETIYQHIMRDRSGLRYCLRFGGYKHHRFKQRRPGAGTNERKRGLDQRPIGANQRLELGHWERDLVVGADGGHACLLTLVDRRSRFTLVRRVESRSPIEVGAKTWAALRPYFYLNRSMTNDNGVEFEQYESLERRMGINVYFTQPSSPWQRGTVENTNGLLRQYVRKGSNFDALPVSVGKWLEDTLNFRPRKVLGFRTPYEVFNKEKLRLMNSQSQLGLEFSALT